MLSEPLGWLGGSLPWSGSTGKKSCSETLHTDHPTVMAGSACPQLFIKPFKQHNQVICVAFCSTLSPLFCALREERDEMPTNKSEALKRVKRFDLGSERKPAVGLLSRKELIHCGSGLCEN